MIASYIKKDVNLEDGYKHQIIFVGWKYPYVVWPVKEELGISLFGELERLAVSYVYGGDISDVEGLKAYASFKEEE
jgi:hypothetical protein|tara:strand:- start:11346 stop:11573 length:228 start_codon:yes stop_codon:yes gene_type:complete